MTTLLRRFAVLSAVALMAVRLASPASAAEVRVMVAGAFDSVYTALQPQFEKQTGHKLITIRGPSVGADRPEAIPNRLARGEAADLLILTRISAETLIQAGLVVPGSIVELVNSQVGFAVKAGAPVPDISTPEKLKDVLLKAKSIGYSASASGVYVSTQLFKKLGIEEVSGKARKISPMPVGEFIANGQVEVGFQQISELMPVKGITLVGPIPNSIQLITPFVLATPTKTANPDAAKQLVAFLTSPKAYGVIQAAGLQPAALAKD